MQCKELVTRRSKLWNIACTPVLVAGLWSVFVFQSVADESLTFKLGLLAEISRNKPVSDYYEARDFLPIWIDSDPESAARRASLLKALSIVSLHALPSKKYNRGALVEGLRSARTESDLGALEAKFTLTYLAYANDVHSGLLKPSKVEELISRKTIYRSVEDYLYGAASDDAVGYIETLPPQTTEYNNLLSARQKLLQVAERGGWGKPVPEGKYSLGDSGVNIVALRNRLISMNYMTRSVSRMFGEEMLHAVKSFQMDHGLLSDGVAGAGTIEELNKSVVDRLKSVTVALERERWMTRRDATEDFQASRTVLVNLTDFTAKILDEGIVTFETRSVIGADEDNQRSPEFSDVMEHMVINPSWYVPRSITVDEYLPNLQEDPTSHDYLTVFTPDTGDVVPREAVDFTLFDKDTFPFELKQLPSPSNALGRVKFMFPNSHNIYLHDTPHKTLFLKEKRAFSHGCIRLQKPFEFAYALLEKQSENPVSDFQDILETGLETTVPLAEPIPVHIVYRTAVTSADGSIGFRRDVYGRDAIIFSALEEAGVVIMQNRG